MARILNNQSNRTVLRSWAVTAMLAVAFACVACLFAAPDAHAAGEDRTWLSSYDLPMEGGVPTLSGNYILAEDLKGKTFHIKDDTNIDLKGHTIDGEMEGIFGWRTC